MNPLAPVVGHHAVHRRLGPEHHAGGAPDVADVSDLGRGRRRLRPAPRLPAPPPPRPPLPLPVRRRPHSRGGRGGVRGQRLRRRGGGGAPEAAQCEAHLFLLGGGGAR